MHVLGHEYVRPNIEFLSASGLVESLSEFRARLSIIQEWLPLPAGKSQEVSMTGDVEAFSIAQCCFEVRTDQGACRKTRRWGSTTRIEGDCFAPLAMTTIFYVIARSGVRRRRTERRSNLLQRFRSLIVARSTFSTSSGGPGRRPLRSSAQSRNRLLDSCVRFEPGDRETIGHHGPRLVAAN